MGFANPRIRRMLILVLLLGLLLVVLTRTRVRWRTLDQRSRNVIHSKKTPSAEKGIVMAKMMAEDIQWALDMSPSWHAYIYTAEKPPEPGYMQLPALRGHEAVPYLTFIIDHYETLPAFTAFVHGSRDQWHNDILGASTADVLRNIRLDHVRRYGFVNLRCSHEPGCPISVNPFSPTETDLANNDTRAFFADIYMELFDVPLRLVPQHLGAPCCGQFIVTRERIRERPRSDYVRFRKWATESTVTDSFGVGWVFEKIWHVMFGMDPVSCPSFENCRCDLFGWCDLVVPERYESLVKGAHPWLGSKLGRVFGNDVAAGDWE